MKALLGKHVKILLKNVVKLETKQDKLENRVLVSNTKLIKSDVHLFFVQLFIDKISCLSLYLLKFLGILAMQVIFVNGKSADKGTLLLGISNRQLITSYK